MGHLVQVVTETFDPISWAIRWKTDSQWSHVEFVNEVTGDTLGAHAIGGVKVRPYRPDNYRQVRRYTAPNIEAAYDWALTQSGKKYDFSAITGIALNRNWHDPDKWFCSELVAAAFEKTPTPLFSREWEPWAIWPRDIPGSLELVRVY